jgi:enoyl-CoA hydratase/carnithine racemase
MLRQWHQDHVSWLVFDRRERLNSFTVADYRDLRLALSHATTDGETRVIVLAGTGRAFSAGADRSLVDGTAEQAEREAAGDEFEMLLEVLWAADKPMLAAVNGLAVGIGCTMLLSCDLVLASVSARFRLPFTALGMVPEAGSSVLLPERTRWGDAFWAALSSEWFDAEAARAMGLVWETAADDALWDRTREVAAVLAGLDPAAVRETKRLLTAGRREAAQLASARERAAMRRLAEREG